jgi:hypothetical protein
VRTSNPKLRATASVLAGALGLALVGPVHAAEAQKTLTAAAVAQVAKLDTSQATTTATQEPSPNRPEAGPSKSFFATPKGIAALLIMAGITGYTIHSRINDAVHSPARK